MPLEPQVLAEARLAVIGAPAVITEEDVPGASQAVHRSKYELVAALVISWVEAPLFVAALRPFIFRPILLRSHMIDTENGVGLTAGAPPGPW
jgi:hypothetical protein